MVDMTFIYDYWHCTPVAVSQELAHYVCLSITRFVCENLGPVPPTILKLALN